ncbi:dihydroorotase [Spirochaetia bacterium]|nr:dihydroorotase [Spirochaetia bacterium]
MGHTLVLKNFHLVDETMDIRGSVVIEDGLIREIIPDSLDFSEDSDLWSVEADKNLEYAVLGADMVIDGRNIAFGNREYIPADWANHLPVLMPALIDLHAHFRDPGFPDKETLESASLAAAAGGFGTVVCMANTNPVTDSPEAASALKARSDALALIDLYPAMSLTSGMAGQELSDITRLDPSATPAVRLLSEDGKDVADDALFLAAFTEARRLGLPVSCHCDAGGPEAEAAKRAGEPRAVWSRIEENAATRRAIALGKQAGCHVHIAHVSTAEAVQMVRDAKAEIRSIPAEVKDTAVVEGIGIPINGGITVRREFTITCEATPHHLALTEETARKLGDESRGRVNPSLRTEADRQAVIAAILDGTIDAIATDHAPHTAEDKEKGAPGFTGLETAFAVCNTVLAREGILSLSRLSSLMSAAPARILGLTDRGRLAPGCRADLLIADTEAAWTVDPARFKSRGKNSPYTGRGFAGRILLTIRRGRVVFEA